MDSREQLYGLYVDYFDRRKESSKCANEFVTSVGAAWLKIEKLSPAQFFAYLERPGINPETKRRWLGRILRGR